jgi:hypothetical protein
MQYLEASQESAIKLVSRGLTGPVVNLNMLRFRDVADYSASPELAPDHPISGAEAYQLYEEATLPIVRKHGGDVSFSGAGGHYFIGPDAEVWDHVLLVRQSSVENFFAMAQDPENMKTIGQRMAGICDSRLLVIDPSQKQEQ